jgi:hypothetical protein
MKKYVRNCPTCGIEICYKSYESLHVCIRDKTNCRRCGEKIRQASRAGKTYVFRKDLTGKVVNNLQVIGFAEEESRSKQYCYWNVQCMNCGILVVKETSHLNKIKGCRHCQLKKKGQAGLNKLFSRYKHGAASNNRSFELSIEKFEYITSSNCYYCNARPSMINETNTKNMSHWGDYTYNGIDRFDNDKGYTTENCVPCCRTCNWAKSNQGPEEFQRYIRGIAENAIAGTIPFLNDVRLRSTNAFEPSPLVLVP